MLREKQSATRLKELGLAWRVVPDDQVFEEAHAVAASIAELPMQCVLDFKKVVNRAAYLDVESAMAMETEVTVRSSADAEAAERTKKFSR